MYKTHTRVKQTTRTAHKLSILESTYEFFTISKTQKRVLQLLRCSRCDVCDVRDYDANDYANDRTE